MKVLKTALAALTVISITSIGSADAQNATVKELQGNIMRNTGITRKEGMLYLKVQMQCKQRGFPHFNIWNRCMQAVYITNDLPMPSSLTGAATFAELQKCASFMNDMEVLLCVQGGS